MERSNGALEGAASAFIEDDEVIVQCEVLSSTEYKPLYVMGFVGKPRACLCLWEPWKSGVGGEYFLCETNNWGVAGKPGFIFSEFCPDLPAEAEHDYHVHWEGYPFGSSVWLSYDYDVRTKFRVNIEDSVAEVYCEPRVENYSCNLPELHSYTYGSTYLITAVIDPLQRASGRATKMTVKLLSELFIENDEPVDPTGWAECFIVFRYTKPEGGTKAIYLKFGDINVPSNVVESENVYAGDSFYTFGDNGGEAQTIDLESVGVTEDGRIDRLELCAGARTARGGNHYASAKFLIDYITFN